MEWETLCKQLTAAGYEEVVEELVNKPYLAACLKSLECHGPTFLHLFGKGAKIKLVARCRSCNMAVDLSMETSGPRKESA